MNRPIIEKTGLLLPFAALRSSNGTSIQKSPPIMNPKIAKISPSTKKICEGMIFRVVNIKVKYHSGLIPRGVGAKGSAFWPTSQGEKTQSTPMIASIRIHPNESFRIKFGKKGTSLTSFLAKPIGLLIPNICTKRI